VKVLASNLQFPEGPVELPDGSIAVVELKTGNVLQVCRDGRTAVYASPGGGPNGRAPGPDGKLFVCNAGGVKFRPGALASYAPADDYDGGSIQTIDMATRAVATLYCECNSHRLSAPNDLVFDRHGGFYFTDIGKKFPRQRAYGGIYYARADGSSITELAYPVLTPNGIGLSPDGTVLYFAETEAGRLWAYDIEAPGVIRKLPFPSPNGARLVCTPAGINRFDSLAVEENGNICVATMNAGCICVIAPDGQLVRKVAVPDVYPTNLCFGGPERKTAFITLSGKGQLLEMAWPSAGLRLN